MAFWMLDILRAEDTIPLVKRGDEPQMDIIGVSRVFCVRLSPLARRLYQGAVANAIEH